MHFRMISRLSTAVFRRTVNSRIVELNRAQNRKATLNLQKQHTAEMELGTEPGTLPGTQKEVARTQILKLKLTSQMHGCVHHS